MMYNISPDCHKYAKMMNKYGHIIKSVYNEDKKEKRKNNYLVAVCNNFC
jgi:hypothetical protein